MSDLLDNAKNLKVSVDAFRSCVEYEDYACHARSKHPPLRESGGVCREP